MPFKRPLLKVPTLVPNEVLKELDKMGECEVPSTQFAQDIYGLVRVSTGDCCLRERNIVDEQVASSIAEFGSHDI